MPKIVIPDQFVGEYKAADHDSKNDLVEAGNALKQKGKTVDAIAERIHKAGWSQELSTWFAGVLVERDEPIELTLSSPVPIAPNPVDLAKEKADNDKMVGGFLAFLGTVWSLLWPFFGIKDTGPTLLCLVVGIAILWEGFARIAVSKGLSRLHGVCAFFMWVFGTAINVFWGMMTAGLQSENVEEYRTMILVTWVLIPPALTWLLFWLVLNASARSKAKKDAAKAQGVSA